MTEKVVKIETHRSGPFQFQVGLDMGKVQPLLDRVTDAQQRFRSMPILPDVATSLEREVLVSSVYGTNTIEAATLTEEETAAALDLSQEEAKAEQQRRVSNIRDAYKLAEKFALDWAHDKFDEQTSEIPVIVFEDMFRDLHTCITDGLEHPHNKPGEYRDNPKGQLTRVGDREHGGTYTLPKCRDDIDMLMKAYIEWVNSEEVSSLSPLLRAPLAHYYFERIHPFWDGNGRVGRVMEVMILKAAGFKYAPFAMSRYYLEHIDEYFTVFNQARKSLEKGEDNPNTVFVDFYLRGMLSVMNHLHGRANSMIGLLLFTNRLRVLLDEKKINTRQYTIATQLLNLPDMPTTQALQRAPWYEALYTKLTAKTRSRDMKGLQEQGLVRIDKNKKYRLEIPGR